MREKWWILAAVSCGTFMATLDSSIVNIALPTLTVSFGSSLPKVKWVVVSYLLIITCLLLPMGRVSDLIGKKRVYLGGLAVFSLGSFLCGWAGSLGVLVLFRILQAVGAAMLMANGPAIITAVFSARERGAALGTLAMVVSAGLIAGPALGGFLISHLGWPSLFWVNLPVALAGIVLVSLLVERDHKPKRTGAFDWAGTVIQTFWLILVILLLDPPAIALFGDAPLPLSRWIVATLIVVLGLVFYQVEKQVASPLFDLALLKNRTFSGSILASFLFFICISPIQVLMPFFLESALQFPPSRAGAWMTTIPLTILVVAPLSGRLSDRIGSQWLTVVGSLLAGFSLLTMGGAFGAGLGSGISEYALIPFLILIGGAVGLFQSPNNSAIMSAVPLSKIGVASALLASVRNLGLVTGTGLATTVASWRLEITGSFPSAFRFTLALGGTAAILATIISVARGGGKNGLET